MKPSSHRIAFFAALAGWLALLVAGSAQAAATLHVGPGVGHPCATGPASCQLWDSGGGNMEVNPLYHGNSIDIYQNAGGAVTVGKSALSSQPTEPLLLILAVPNVDALSRVNLFASNPITGVTFYNTYDPLVPTSHSSAGIGKAAASGTFGLSPIASNGYARDLTAGHDVYNLLNLPPPLNASENFTNLSGAEKSLQGITANNFGLYVFALWGPKGLGPNGLANITFNTGAIPTGTFAMAYGHKTTSYTTPFTQAGITRGHRVPEPASLSLIVIAAVGGMWFSRQRTARSV